MKNITLFVFVCFLANSIQAQCPSNNPIFEVAFLTGDDNGICNAKFIWTAPGTNGLNCIECEGSWEINGIEVSDSPCAYLGSFSNGTGIYTVTHYVGDNSYTLIIDVFEDCSFEIVTEIDNPEAPCLFGFGLVDFDCISMQPLPWSYSCVDTYQDLSQVDWITNKWTVTLEDNNGIFQEIHEDENQIQVEYFQIYDPITRKFNFRKVLSVCYEMTTASGQHFESCSSCTPLPLISNDDRSRESEVFSEKIFKVYPTLSNGNNPLNIEYLPPNLNRIEELLFNIDLINQFGNRVLEQQFDGYLTSIDVSNLQDGVYSVVVKDESMKILFYTKVVVKSN